MLGRGAIPIVHDQHLLISEARLSFDLGLTPLLSLSALLPVRMIDTSIRYLDSAGDEVELVDPGIHHRNETVSGLADPTLLLAASRARDAWRFTARAGFTVPIGRTEEDPFRLGGMGVAHQHIQMGTGTFNPVLALEVTRRWERWRVGAFALTQQAVYENDKGYQAGDRYAGGLVASRRLGERFTVRASLETQAETAERWAGTVHTDDGNRGRFDLLAGAAASWAATDHLGLDLAVKLPLVTHAVGGQLEMPAILELGVSYSFGSASSASRTDASPPLASHDDDHGHAHAHDDGHDHAHDSTIDTRALSADAVHPPGADHASGEAVALPSSTEAAAQPAPAPITSSPSQLPPRPSSVAVAPRPPAPSAAPASPAPSAPAPSARPLPLDPLDPTGIDLANYGAPGEAKDLRPVPGKQLTVFDFRADWCKACHELDPLLLALARAFPDRIAIRRIDVVDWESPAAIRYLVPKNIAIPHLKVLDAKGALLLERTTDRRGPRALVEAVRQLLPP